MSSSDRQIRFGVAPNLYPMDTILKAASLAEKANLDSVMMADHTVAFGIKRFDALEAWSVLAALATKTKRIRLGTCVSDPHRRHPATLAQTVATVDIISKGRVILGMGAGESTNVDPFGVSWNRPVSRLRETIVIMRRLWSEDVVNYSGEFFKLHGATLEPKPVQKPHPPIWLGANSPRTIGMTGELADGWLPLAWGPKWYRRNLTEIKRQAKRGGRDPGEIVPGVFMYIGVAEDQETANRSFGFATKFVLLTYGMDEVIQKLGYAPVPSCNLLRSPLTRERGKEMLTVIKGFEVPFEDLQRAIPFPVGTPEFCIELIEDYAKAGARYFLLVPLASPEMFQKVFELCVNEVIPGVLG